MATEQQYAFQDQAPSPSTQLNPNSLVLLPYSYVQETWTLSDGVLKDIYDKCEDEGTLRTVFYEGRIQNVDQFIQMMKSPTNIPVFVFRGYVPIGFAWLNGCSGYHAFGHFCFLKASWGRDSREAAAQILHYWLSFARNDGEPMFDVILGTIPAFNTRACEFVQKIGFKKACVIPNMMRVRGERDDAWIFYLSRFEHG